LGIFDQHDSAFTFFVAFSGEIGRLRLNAAFLVLWHPSRNVGLVSPRILSDGKNHRRYGNYWLRTIKGVRTGKGWRSTTAHLCHADHATLATKNCQSSHR